MPIVIEQASTSQDTDRTEAFRTFARRRSEHEVVCPPLLLPPRQRRLYVRATLREDNQFRIKNRPEGAKAKFDKLASSAFSFFRGTALLFYRDIAGIDSGLPTVFTIGDVHPENFGVMPNEDGAPFFGVNDFDEAYFAPFSWDIRRGALGFYVAGVEHGLAPKKCRSIVKRFVDGYVDGLLEFAQDDREKWHEFRIDNSPPLLCDLLESAKESRESFLEDLIDLDKGRFVSSDEIVPHTKYVKKFQTIVDAYRDENEVAETSRGGHFEVKDVAVKKDSGTASLGLDRYFVLIDGATDDNSDDLILELKQSRRSALFGLTPGEREYDDKNEAERIVKSQQIHLMGGDRYYGYTMIDDQDFLVRERSPFKDDIDLDDLSKSEWKEYARICGKTLSIAHARSDEDTGIMEGDAEKIILGSIRRKLFRSDIVHFAETASEQLHRDHAKFQKDHEKGAFEFSKEG